MKRFAQTFRKCLILVFLALLMAGSVAAVASAHGPGGHHGQGITPFKAVQKAMGLYDQLLEQKKLEESWETDLGGIGVQMREKNGTMEYAVRFERTKGSPSTVYIFLTPNGEYSGSNFTGE